MAIHNKEHSINNGASYLLKSCQEGDCRAADEDGKPKKMVTQGHAVCSCGMKSPHTYDLADRQRWGKMHTLDPEKRFSLRDLRGMNHGQAGKSLGSDSAKGSFGSANTKAGASGERAFESMIMRDSDLAMYDRWKSLRIPAKPGQKRYSSDVDFVMANGNSVVLIDVKRWEANKVYWSIGGTQMKGFSVMKEKQSRNMELALARYREAMPGVTVHAITLFMPTPKGLPTSVRFLTFPGGIRSYLPSDGARKIKSLLGAPTRDRNERLHSVMGSMTR